MMLRLLLLLLIVLVAAHCFGQPAAPALSRFLLPGYADFARYTGDLNGDSLEDVVLVLFPDGEDTLSSRDHPMKRPLLLLLGQRDGSYRQALRNDNVVYHFAYDENFREALVDIRVAGGRLTIDQYGGFARRWGRSTTFAWSAAKKDWYLERDEWNTFRSVDQGDPRELVLSPKNTGAPSIRTFNIYAPLSQKRRDRLKL